MPSSNQQAEKAYKKLQGKALTGKNKPSYEEPYFAPMSIYPNQIWLEYGLIPTTAPTHLSNGQTEGVVKRYKDLVLTQMLGASSSNSFYNAELKDCIPTGVDSSYAVEIITWTADPVNNRTVISNGVKDWEIDMEAGVLTFFGDANSSGERDNTIPAVVNSNDPNTQKRILISFYKYVGTKGSSVVFLDQKDSVANTYTFNVLNTSYTPSAVYLLNIKTNNTASSSININELGAKPIKKVGASGLVDLASGDLKTGTQYILSYSNTGYFQLLSGGVTSVSATDVSYVNTDMSSTNVSEALVWLYSNKLSNIDDYPSDIRVKKNHAWLTLHSANNDESADDIDQAAGISLGESGKKGSAAVHLTYNGDGSSYLGMGKVDATTNIPKYAVLKMKYESNDAEFQGSVIVGKDSDSTSTITFPAASDGDDAGFIKHIEKPKDAAEMRFSVSDNDDDNDKFVFGNTQGTVWTERFVIKANGNLSTSGTLKISNTNVSTSTTTGALTVAGGVGIGNGLFVAGATNMANVPTFWNTTANTNLERGISSLIYSAIASGKCLYHDEEFATSNNNVIVYNNSGGTSVVITRQADSSAPNTSGQVLKIAYDGGTASPGLGGFVQYIQSRRNAVFVQRFRAKIPTGYTVWNNENPIGTGGQVYWITPRVGTGKWEEYIRVVSCGHSGTFSNSGYVNLTGTTGTAGVPMEWYLASCTAFEVNLNPLNSLRAGTGIKFTTSTTQDTTLGNISIAPDMSVAWAFTNTTASTTTSTGALTVAGGVGVGGALYVNSVVNAAHFEAKPVDGNGYRFWESSDAYKIYMAKSDMADAGNMIGNADYNMYFRMSGLGTVSAETRGFVFQHGGNNTFQINGNGDVKAAGSITASGNVSSTSDISVKTNIRPYINGLEKVLALNAVIYDRKDIESDNEIGFIAQEVEKVEPALVKQRELLSLDYSRMVTLLTSAVQEQQKQIEELKSEISNLKTKNK
jgi:hypothetical protein